MSRRRDVPCAGKCGRLLWRSGSSALKPRCRDCRQAETVALGGVQVDGVWKYRRACQTCGSEFLGQSRRAKFCSLTCAHAKVSGRLADYASERERNAMKCHRRRLRQLAVYGEEVIPSVVFERDGWVCQLCQEPVDPTVSGRFGAGATLDHIVPISVGGPHTYANVQLAHKSCNSRKHANWRGQLVLL